VDRAPPTRPAKIGAPFEAVLAAAQSGAPWALNELYDSVAPAVAGYVRVQGSPEPHDLASDILYRALSGLRSFAGDEEGFRSWVFTIAHHRLVDERRTAARRPVLAEERPDAAATVGGDVEEEAFWSLGTERVRRLCAGLAPDQRDVLLLRMVAGMTLDETAETLGKSQGAVKSLQHRAVATLRRRLPQEGVSP